MTLLSPPESVEDHPQPSPVRAPGVAIAAAIVGGIAFLLGLVPVLGLILGVVGLVLGIIAIRRPGGRGLGIGATVASGLAVAANIIAIIVMIAVFPAFKEGFDSALHDTSDSAVDDPGGEMVDDVYAEAASGDPIAIDTPCYAFEGPAGYINNQPDAAGEMCITSLELWGELGDDGEVVNTGVGAVYGQVSVEPITASLVESWGTTGDLSATIDRLGSTYFPDLGAIDSLREPVALGGVEANVTRATSGSEVIKTAAAIVAFSPDNYSIDFGEGAESVSFWVVVVVTPYDGGDEIIDTVLDTWEWK